jgi:hypothetical protein
MSDTHNMIKRHPKLPIPSVRKRCGGEADLTVAGHVQMQTLGAIADCRRHNFTGFSFDPRAVAGDHDGCPRLQIAPAHTAGPVLVVGRVLGLGLRLGSGGGGCSSSSRRSRCRAPGAGHLGAVRWRDVGSEAVAMPGGAFRSAARHAGLRGGEQRVSQRHWGTYYPCGILGSEAPAQPLTGAIWLCGYAAVVRWTLLGPLRSADPRCCTSGGFTGSPRCCAPVAPPYKRFGGQP